uniref:Uncharacterized protein n=1 Tax=Strigamia maritima TaxID=126957 RepID=T1JGJ6_STRMM
MNWNQKDELESEKDELQSEKDELESEKDELESEKDELESENENEQESENENEQESENENEQESESEIIKMLIAKQTSLHPTLSSSHQSSDSAIESLPTMQLYISFMCVKNSKPYSIPKTNENTASTKGSVEGLAFEKGHNELYWTCNNDASIIGLHTQKLNWAPLSTFAHRRLYWTNWNSRQASIQRSYPSGYDLHVIVTTDIDIRMPNAY